MHLQTVTEVLQSIKASEMTPMLQRIYQSEGGSEALDVLMKYLYVASPSIVFFPVPYFSTMLLLLCTQGPRRTPVLTLCRYKGMASSTPSSRSGPARSSNVTPQSTGFSQMGGRPGAPNESSGAAMSVLLSWHEKVVEVAGLGCVGRCMTDWRKV